MNENIFELLAPLYSLMNENYWNLLAAILGLYEAIVAIWPTVRNYSAITAVFKGIRIILPNRKAGGGHHRLKEKTRLEPVKGIKKLLKKAS